MQDIFRQQKKNHKSFIKKSVMNTSKHNYKQSFLNRAFRRIAKLFLISFNTVSKYNGLSAFVSYPLRGAAI